MKSAEIWNFHEASFCVAFLWLESEVLFVFQLTKNFFFSAYISPLSVIMLALVEAIGGQFLWEKKKQVTENFQESLGWVLIMSVKGRASLYWNHWNCCWIWLWPNVQAPSVWGSPLKLFNNFTIYLKILAPCIGSFCWFWVWFFSYVIKGHI